VFNLGYDTSSLDMGVLQHLVDSVDGGDRNRLDC
jgi:hypothetical protein